jgi:hypothetical protein
MVDKQDILDILTTEDVIDILISMGSAYPKNSNDGGLLFTTICHGGHRHKLHYIPDEKFFMCYTSCGGMSIFNLLMNVNGWTFIEALMYLAKYKGIDVHTKGVGLQKPKIKNEDFDFLDKHEISTINEGIQLPEYNSHVLSIFSNYCPNSWVNEGIKEEIMEIYGIKFYFNQFKAIIPHYDKDGRLVGIRGRNFIYHEDGANSNKYMPISIQGTTYKYPTNFNLYGLHQNKDNIKRIGKAILIEGEKSVLKYASYYGQGSNITLGTLGMNLSVYQRNLILELNIDEVIIAFDKQYQIDFIDSGDKTTNEYKEYVAYIKKITKIVSMLIDYCNVSVIFCWDDRIGYKDAPIDCGIDIFEDLMTERYFINDIEELKELIE